MKKAEVSIQGILIGILTLGLFFGVFGAIVSMMGADYDISHIDQNDLIAYQVMPNLSNDIKSAADDVDQVTVDPNAFDYLSNLFAKITTPFKTTYQSFRTLKSITKAATSDLNLMKQVTDYLITLITILVIIGIVMIKYFMGRQK